MSLLRNIASGIPSLFRKERFNRELDDESRGFLEMAEEEKMKQGMSRQEALRAGRLERGSLGVTKDVICAKNITLGSPRNDDRPIGPTRSILPFGLRVLDPKRVAIHMVGTNSIASVPIRPLLSGFGASGRRNLGTIRIPFDDPSGFCVPLRFSSALEIPNQGDLLRRRPRVRVPSSLPQTFPTQLGGWGSQVAGQARRDRRCSREDRDRRATRCSALAALTLIPLFKGLAHYANPQLATAARTNPVLAAADPSTCGFQ